MKKIRTALSLPNPLSALKMLYEHLKEGEAKVDTGFTIDDMSQDEFFARLIQWMYSTKERLLIVGYDAPFMDKEQTLRAISSITQRGEQPVYVSAIIPDSLKDNSPLEELANNNSMVTVMGTSMKDDKGFIVYDRRISFWDSTQSTHYLPEANTGVISRMAKPNIPYFEKFIKIYGDLKQQARSQQSHH